MFAPSRGRELKSCLRALRCTACCVRPLAGAGIEMGCKRKWKHHLLVRPLAGAGIEITLPLTCTSKWRCSPPRGGGN